MKRKGILFGAAMLAALASGCAEDAAPGGGAGGNAGTGGTAGIGGGGGATATTDLSLEFTDLPELGADFVYEGWLITDDGPISTGRFTVDSDGALSESSFSVDALDASSAGAFVLTIEPTTGDDPAPSDTHIVAGDLAEGSAQLSIAHAAALGDDFTGAVGEYILAAPTGGEGTPFQYGIWWLIPGEPPSPGLALPVLPAGWAYEGWVASADGPVSTGRFTDAAAADSDGAGPDAGPETDAAPPFPGQDFVDPSRDLSDGYTAVISVEPDPDDGAAPFFIKPLVHPIASVEPPTTQVMDNNAEATSPTGTATLTP
jgi:hypothetical protein